MAHCVASLSRPATSLSRLSLRGTQTVNQSLEHKIQDSAWCVIGRGVICGERHICEQLYNFWIGHDRRGWHTEAEESHTYGQGPVKLYTICRATRAPLCKGSDCKKQLGPTWGTKVESAFQFPRFPRVCFLKNHKLECLGPLCQVWSVPGSNLSIQTWTRHGDCFAASKTFAQWQKWDSFETQSFHFSMYPNIQTTFIPSPHFPHNSTNGRILFSSLNKKLLWSWAHYISCSEPICCGRSTSFASQKFIVQCDCRLLSPQLLQKTRFSFHVHAKEQLQLSWTWAVTSVVPGAIPQKQQKSQAMFTTTTFQSKLVSQTALFLRKPLRFLGQSCRAISLFEMEAQRNKDSFWATNTSTTLLNTPVISFSAYFRSIQSAESKSSTSNVTGSEHPYMQNCASGWHVLHAWSVFQWSCRKKTFQQSVPEHITCELQSEVDLLQPLRCNAFDE